MNISEFLFNTPFGVFLVVVLLLVAAIVAIGAGHGNGLSLRRNRAETPPPSQQPQPANTSTAKLEEPLIAPPKQEPKPAPPKPEPEQPCAKERQEIERLKKDLEEARKPKPPIELTEQNVLNRLAKFGEINSKGEKDLRAEAADPEPSVDAVEHFLVKFAKHLRQTGYTAPEPKELLKLLTGAIKPQRHTRR